MRHALCLELSMRLMYLLVLCGLPVSLMGQTTQPPLVRPDTLMPRPLPAPTQQVTAFEPGELLHYQVRFGPISAATATVGVYDSGLWRGRPTWEIRAEGRTKPGFDWIFKVRDVYRSYYDPALLAPVRFVRDVQEGGYEIHQDYRFDWERNCVETEWHRKRGRHEAFAVEAQTQDMVSAFFTARNWNLDDLERGDLIHVPCIVDGELFPLTISYGGRTTIEVEEGTWVCDAFHPVIMAGRIWERPDDLTVYVSADSNRIPVLVSTRVWVGSVELELMETKGLRNPSARQH